VDLILVRHAEPVRIDAVESGGRPVDPPLTPRGVEQADRLADWLAHEQIDAVLSSPLQRARQTATPIARVHDLEVEIVDGIIEYDVQADHYIPVDELRAKRDPQWFAMIEGRWTDFGGDSPGEFCDRVARSVDEIIGRFAGLRVVAVCHGGVINVAMASILGIDRLLWFDAQYTSLSRVVASREGVRSVVSLNECAHLEAERRPRRAQQTRSRPCP